MVAGSSGRRDRGLRDRNWVHHVDARRTARLVTGRVVPSYDDGGLDRVRAVTD